MYQVRGLARFTALCHPISKVESCLSPFSVKYAAFIFIVFFHASVSFGADNWQELKGSHFIIYFTNHKETSGSNGVGRKTRGVKFAKDVLRKAEQRYTRTAEELGYQRSNFWMWENRVKIYIYPDRASYIATGQPEWSDGLADYANRVILSYQSDNEKNVLENILPHELGHLIFRDFIGFKNDVPLWLDEGVAQWQEEKKRKAVMRVIREVFRKGRFLTLKKMIAMDTAHLKDKMDEKSVGEFYMQAVSLVDFLITKYGKRRFTKLCRRLRGGGGLNEALRFSYPASIRDMGSLEDEWIKYIEEGIT